ncbi:MAG: hypothetical protein HY541_09415, partial [Deltaproteobacteria bacterium]|nr:hypothetical protein [Deltaproteobacteria bacterium]
MPLITLRGSDADHLKASGLLDNVEYEITGQTPPGEDGGVEITLNVKPVSLKTFADHFVNDASLASASTGQLIYFWDKDGDTRTQNDLYLLEQNDEIDRLRATFIEQRYAVLREAQPAVEAPTGETPPPAEITAGDVALALGVAALNWAFGDDESGISSASAMPIGDTFPDLANNDVSIVALDEEGEVRMIGLPANKELEKKLGTSFPDNDSYTAAIQAYLAAVLGRGELHLPQTESELAAVDLYINNKVEEGSAFNDFRKVQFSYPLLTRSTTSASGEEAVWG